MPGGDFVIPGLPRDPAFSSGRARKGSGTPGQARGDGNDTNLNSTIPGCAESLGYAKSLGYDRLMQQVLGMTYLWLKAGHVIFVIFWMAGLFMLPRYFVYHQEAEPGSPENAVWIERESKLLKIILWPSLVVAWVLGLSLAWSQGYFALGWFHAKLALVLALTGYHVWLAGYAKALARGERRLSGRQLRMLNEIPGIAAALIVVLVIVRPF
jgi:putative membrane protein